ncbi:hypothetical protein RIVM261_048530 [Rivularia sp. IAM M-261]|nr:hypothetical protein RIVM261_048530 [Rivularia sp. IAM M-261]
MIWSLSAAKTFKKCQRQWYFKNCLSDARAKDSRRHEAYLLSKLQSISAWRGSIVDAVISNVIVPAINKRNNISLKQVQKIAMEQFDKQLAFACQHPLHLPGLQPTKVGDEFAVFHCMEYGGNILEEEIEIARKEVKQALANLFEMSNIWIELKAAEYIITQRTLTFPYTEQIIRAVPDLIAFFKSKPPLIVDWKVHSLGVYRASKQLGIYALALLRCNPHKDFPKSLKQWQEIDIRVLEVQLLTNQIRQYTLDDYRISEIETYMGESITEMQLLVQNVKKKAMLDPLEFLAAQSPETCQRCNYQSLCWCEE